MTTEHGRPDRVVAALTIAFTILGLLSVTNTSAPMAVTLFGDALFFIKQQLMWAILGCVALIGAYVVPISLWKKYSPLIFGVCVVLLVVVLIPGFGAKLLGARRWIHFGPISIQPSETIKLALAIFLAYLAEKKAPIKHFIWTLVGVCGLIMLQPDLGTTIVVSSIAFSQFLIAGIPLMHLFIVSVGGVLAGLVMALSSDYRRARIITFLSRTDDVTGSAYHVKQILIALGSGGVLGVGLGQSRQKHLFLPETATDSVFAVIAEEVGFIGASFLILALTFFVLRLLKIARNAPDTYSKVLATGIAVWIGSQVFFNIASMVSLTPLTGIPLPFFSYGGSSLTMILFSIGILLQISRYGKNK